MSLDDLSGVMLDVGELVLVPIALKSHACLRCEQSVHTKSVGDELGGRLTDKSCSTRGIDHGNTNQLTQLSAVQKL